MDKLAIAKEFLAKGNEFSGEMEHKLAVRDDEIEMGNGDEGWNEYSELDALKDAAQFAEDVFDNRKLWNQAKKALIAVGEAVEVSKEQLDATVQMGGNGKKYWFKDGGKFYVYNDGFYND